MALYAQAILNKPNSTEDEGGSVLFPGLVPLGELLLAAADHVQPSAAECCNACRQLPRCNVYWYCETEGGCRSSAYNLSAPLGGCQLVEQVLTKPGTGRPVLLVPAPAFTGGAPLRYAAAEVPGYDVWPGLGFWYRFDLECPDSVSQPGSCGLRGGPQENAVHCTGDAGCQVMMAFPDGRDYPGAGQPVVLLKGGKDVVLDIENANINLNAVLYSKKSAGQGGGLSGAQVAGIVVGAACGLALVAAGGFLALRHWRRREVLGLAAQLSSGGGSGKGSAAGAADGEHPPDPGSAVGTGSEHHTTMIAGLPFGSAAGREQGQLLVAAWSGLGSVPSSESAVSSAADARLALPPGMDVSLRTAGPLGRPASRMLCPTPPPPSLNSSTAATRGLARLTLPLGVAAARPAGTAGVSPAGAGSAAVTLGVSPPTAGTLPLQSAAARKAPPSPAAHALLSHLPTYGWQRCIVDYSAIQFVLRPDGSYDELGSGASATVYKVLLNGVEPHAAKVFRLGSDPELQLYFLEEAGLLRLLRHRCVVGFAGLCVADGNGIILMELMEGGDLRSRNREVDADGRRVFGWHQRGRRVALDIACALNFLHESSYTHFDLKSRNVLISRDLTAKLADVGFARAMRATHHSIEGPTGTFDYMAPELLTGRKCNNSVDSYSFGVLLWETVTGEYPRRGSLREPLSPAECPQEAADLIADCLQEDPALRPTAAQLVERLTRLQ